MAYNEALEIGIKMGAFSKATEVPGLEGYQKRFHTMNIAFVAHKDKLRPTCDVSYFWTYIWDAENASIWKI